MPSFGNLLKGKKATSTVNEHRETKKQKMVLGPAQPARQSDMIDRSKNLMEKAMELKDKKKNYDIVRRWQIEYILPFSYPAHR
jgi:hypothetical protein